MIALFASVCPNLLVLADIGYYLFPLASLGP